MKTAVMVLAAVALLSAASCAKSRTLVIDGQKTVVDPYGMYSEFFDKSRQNPKAQYRLSTGNVVLSVIFSETLIVPVILCGWYLWEPVTNR